MGLLSRARAAGVERQKCQYALKSCQAAPRSAQASGLIWANAIGDSAYAVTECYDCIFRNTVISMVIGSKLVSLGGILGVSRCDDTGAVALDYDPSPAKVLL
jgi:hypothetical protein